MSSQDRDRQCWPKVGIRNQLMEGKGKRREGGKEDFLKSLIKPISKEFHRILKMAGIMTVSLELIHPLGKAHLGVDPLACLV